MAEIVQTLFGVSPESYQQQQSALADQRALQYAKLDPFQQANYAIGRGAYGLAGAIGGALGGQDPELQLISARNSIAKQINFSDLNSIAQGIQMLGDAGDTVGMMQLTDIYRKAQESGALVTQRQREALTSEQRNSDVYAKQFGVPGSQQYETAFKQKFDELTSKPGASIYSTIDASKYTPASLAVFEVSGKRSDLVATTPKENLYSPIDASKYTPESLLAFDASGKRSDLVAITPKDNLYAAINASDYTPASLAVFEVSGKRSDLVARDKPFAPPAPDRLFAPINASDYTPASVAAFEASGNRADLVAIIKPVAGGVSFGTDANRISLELFGKPFGDLSQQQQAAVNKRVEGEKKASAPNLTVVNAVQKGFGENLTETITSTVKAGRVARQTIGAVDNMQTLLDEGVRTGFGQDTMLQVGKVGQLLNPDFNVKGLAGAEALQSISTNLVLPQVKQLGVNPTDTDLKFINTGSPGLSKTVAGNKLMLSALRLKLQREQDAATFTNNWLSQNGKLTTTNPTEGYVKYNSDFDTYTQQSPLYGPSANKLREQFNALGGTAPGGRQTPTARDATNRGGLTRP
jgi:hypothetical protein